LIDRLDYVTKQLIQALLVQILQANQAWMEDLIDLIDWLGIVTFVGSF
jgi:hypothetical protein